MRFIYFTTFFIFCDCVPRTWLNPCLAETTSTKSTKSIKSRQIELGVLVDLILFETEDIKYGFDIFVHDRMCFLTTDNMNSVQMLGIFHATAFYINRLRRKYRLNRSTSILLEIIRVLRCEIETGSGLRPLSWKRLKAKIINVDMTNLIFEKYLIYSLRNFLYKFKNNVHLYEKIKKIC